MPFSEWIVEVEQYADRTHQDRNITLRRLLRDGALHNYLEMDEYTRQDWEQMKGIM
ncbi:MAG: hypothetical protein GY928_38365 [Colwellia sp.]|nr:hypothetical protein [Colwellia sp.]